MRVRIGTSGWSYRDWVGPFYPAGMAAREYLPHYARCFGAVEVDSTFYGIPRRSTVERWAEATPEDFSMAPKVPGIITHGAEGRRPDPTRVLRDEEGSLERFLEALDPLGPRLGPLVFQFPYFRVGLLTASDFRDRLAAVLDRLPRGVRAAVEIRNKGWVREEYLSILGARGAAAVMIDHPYMPPPPRQLELGMTTADFAYIRLLGDRRAIERITTSWGAPVIDRTGRLAEWAEVIETVRRRGGMREIYIFSNNHYAGHGPATCEDLRARLGGGGTPDDNFVLR